MIVRDEKGRDREEAVARYHRAPEKTTRRTRGRLHLAADERGERTGLVDGMLRIKPHLAHERERLVINLLVLHLEVEHGRSRRTGGGIAAEPRRDPAKSAFNVEADRLEIAQDRVGGRVPPGHGGGASLLRDGLFRRHGFANQAAEWGGKQSKFGLSKRREGGLASICMVAWSEIWWKYLPTGNVRFIDSTRD